MSITILRGIEYLGNINQVDVNPTNNPGVYPNGAIIVDRNSNTLKIGDGATQGGVALSLASSVAWSSITGIPASLTAISDDSTDFQYNNTTNTLSLGGGTNINVPTIVSPDNSLIIKSDANNVQIDTPNGAFVVNAQNNIDIGSDNAQVHIHATDNTPSVDPVIFIESTNGRILIRSSGNDVDIEGQTIGLTGNVTATNLSSGNINVDGEIAITPASQGPATLYLRDEQIASYSPGESSGIIYFTSEYGSSGGPQMVAQIQAIVSETSASEPAGGQLDFYTLKNQNTQLVARADADRNFNVYNNFSAPNGTISGTNLTTAGIPGVIKAYAHVDVSAPITASADYNVASVTSSATGKYDVTFTNALPNANYVVSLSVQTNVSSNHYTVCYYNRTTTGFQVQKFLDGVLDSGASGNFSFVIYQA
jgi:hypothetical protein